MFKNRYFHCSNHHQVTSAKTGKCKSNCDCHGHHEKNNTKISGRQQNQQRKRKNVEKENIDSETLAKYKALEWESRTGYWCQRCKIKFDSSDLLVDHMAKNVHKSSVPPPIVQKESTLR